MAPVTSNNRLHPAGPVFYRPTHHLDMRVIDCPTTIYRLSKYRRASIYRGICDVTRCKQFLKNRNTYHLVNNSGLIDVRSVGGTYQEVCRLVGNILWAYRQYIVCWRKCCYWWMTIFSTLTVHSTVTDNTAVFSEDGNLLSITTNIAARVTCSGPFIAPSRSWWILLPLEGAIIDKNITHPRNLHIQPIICYDKCTMYAEFRAISCNIWYCRHV